MAKLLSKDIGEILDARLDCKCQVEFQIKSTAAIKNTTLIWLEEKSISKNTLRSNLFCSFYQNIDSSIHSIHDLRTHLIALKNSSNNANDSNVSSNDNHDKVLKIKVKIKETEETFGIKKLKSISYFNAMLSDRWLKDRDLDNTTIDVFGDNNNSNSSNSCGFNCTILKWLLECVALGKITPDLPPEIQYLHPLIECHDYFMNKQDSIISIDSLIGYFNSIKPLTIKQRQVLFNTTTSDVLKQAIATLNKELNDEMDKMRKDMVNNISTIKSFENIRFDQKTAIMLLNEKLQFSESLTTNSRRQLAIRIKLRNNHIKKEDCRRLWHQCNWGSALRDLTVIKQLITTVNGIESARRRTIRVENSRSGYILDTISDMLADIAHHATAEACGMNNETFEQEILVLNKVRWKIFHERSCDKLWYLTNARQYFNSVLVNLENNSDAIEQFLSFVLKKHEEYFVPYRKVVEGNDDLKKKVEFARRSYYCLIRDCLLLCRSEWVVQNAELWFPITYQDTSSVSWIMQYIVGKMNTQTGVKFGIYLTKYITYQWDSRNAFPKPYLNFLRDHLGINWELTNARQDDNAKHQHKLGWRGLF